MIRQLRQSEFARSVLVLTTGTVLAQLISYLVYPFLTRIYSPEEMGDLGLYMRIVAFVSAIATARYELSLPIAARDQHAFMLYRFSFRIALVILSAMGLMALGYFLASPYEPDALILLIMTIISAYVAVWINLGTHWSIRMKAFKRISQQRVVNAFSTNILRLIFGMFSWGTIGLIFATMIGSLLSGIVFIREFFIIRKFYNDGSSRKRMRVLGRQFSHFPRINLPHALLDMGMDLLVAMLIVYFYGDSVFGSYSHAYAMLRLPLMLIGQSVGQVFYSRCSELANAGESVVPLLIKTYRMLFLIAIVPFTLLFFYGEELFAFVFSEQWRESGQLAEIMAPWLMLNFVLSPVSGLPLVFGRQTDMFIIGIISAAMQLVIYGLLPLITTFDIHDLLLITAISQILILIAGGWLYLRFAQKGRTKAL